MARGTRAAAAAVLLLSAAGAGRASDLAGRPSLGAFTLVVENDAIHSDRNYTSGLLLAFVSGERDEGSATRWLGRHLLFADDEDRVRFGVAVGQSIYTPDDIGTRDPLPREHPYAGWLYGALSLLVEGEHTLDTLNLDLGIVGPSAQAEEAQNYAHEVLGSRDAVGWTNQLENEVAFTLSYDRKWRLFSHLECGGLELDLTPNAGVSLGTVLTQANAGLTLRLGDDLRNDFGPLRVRPGLGGSGLLHVRDAIAGYVFIGVLGRAVARNLFLDGNTWRSSADVQRRPFGADFQAGAVLQVFALQAGVTVVVRTSEFEPQTEADVFGSVFLSLRL